MMSIPTADVAVRTGQRAACFGFGFAGRWRTIVLWLAVGCGLPAIPARPAGAQGEEEAVTVFRRVSGAVVSLESPASSGTGVMLDQNGTILTNAHVVAVPLKFRCTAEVEKAGKRQTVSFSKVQLIGVHPTLDMAIVRIDPKEHQAKLTVAKLSKRPAQTGQRVYAIGNPAGSSRVKLTKTITAGLLSGVDRVIDDVAYYQFSAAISPGNSGGPLCDRAGEVIGLVTLKLTDAENVGFALPLDGLKPTDFKPFSERPGDPKKSGELIEVANKLVKEYTALKIRRQDDSPRGQVYRVIILQLYQEALMLNPKNPTIYSALASILSELDEDDAAEAYLQSALEMAPWGADPRIFRVYALVLMKRKKVHEAATLLEEGARKHPLSAALLWEDLALLYRDAGQRLSSARSAALGLNSGGPRGRPEVLMALLERHRAEASDPQERAALNEIVGGGMSRLMRQAVAERNLQLAGNSTWMTHAYHEFISKAVGKVESQGVGVPPLLPLPAPRTNSQDLLASLGDETQSGGETWRRTKNMLFTPAADFARLPLSAAAPLPAAADYDLTIDLLRHTGAGSFTIGFSRQGRTSLFVVDHGGSKSGLAGVPTGMATTPVLEPNKFTELLLRVRQDGLTVLANGKQIYSYASKEPFPEVPKSWASSESASVFLGCHQTTFVVAGAWLSPIERRSNEAPTVVPDPPSLAVARPNPSGLSTVPPSQPGVPRPARSVPTDTAAPTSSGRQVWKTGDLGWGVNSLAISPNGKFVAAGKMDGLVLLFDMKTGEKLSDRDDFRSAGQIQACCFTPAGDKLLTASYSGGVKVWEVNDGGTVLPRQTFVEHGKEVVCVRVSGDGKFVLSADRDGGFKYWDLQTAKEIWHFAGARNFGPKAIHLSQDGANALLYDGESLHTVDAKTGQVRDTRAMARSSSQSADLSPDGTQFACNDGYSIRLWAAQKGLESPPLKDKEIQWKVLFSADGKRLYAGGRGKFTIWDVASGKAIESVVVGGGILYVKAIAESPDGKFVAAIPSSAGQALQLFRVDDTPHK